MFNNFQEFMIIAWKREWDFNWRDKVTNDTMNILVEWASPWHISDHIPNSYLQARLYSSLKQKWISLNLYYLLYIFKFSFHYFRRKKLRVLVIGSKILKIGCWQKDRNNYDLAIEFQESGLSKKYQFCL